MVGEINNDLGCYSRLSQEHGKRPCQLPRPAVEGFGDGDAHIVGHEGIIAELGEAETYLVYKRLWRFGVRWGDTITRLRLLQLGCDADLRLGNVTRVAREGRYT